MGDSVRFFVKFVLVSVIGFAALIAFSRGYLIFLSLQTNAFFRVTGHPAELRIQDRIPHIVYPDIHPQNQPETGIQVPIYRSIAIYFNLIMLVALFTATPLMPISRKIQSAASGAVLLSLSHTAHVYFLSHVFIWGYIAQQNLSANVPPAEIHRLIEEVERRFSPNTYAYFSTLETYWNSFFREIGPLLIWLNFAYPYLNNELIAPPEISPGNERRRKAAENP